MSYAVTCPQARGVRLKQAGGGDVGHTRLCLVGKGKNSPPLKGVGAKQTIVQSFASLSPHNSPLPHEKDAEKGTKRTLAVATPPHNFRVQAETPTPENVI